MASADASTAMDALTLASMTENDAVRSIVARFERARVDGGGRARARGVAEGSHSSRLNGSGEGIKRSTRVH